MSHAVTAFEAGVRALARRDLTSSELERRLARAGFPEADRQQAVARLRSAGYLDDGRAATERARVLAERGFGNAAIAADLSSRGTSSDALADVLASLEPELDRARGLAVALGGGLRSARTLSRKGFSREVVEAVSAVAIAEEP